MIRINILIFVAGLYCMGCSNSSETSQTNEPESEMEVTEEPSEDIADSDEMENSPMAGKFIYYADAATFENCADGTRLDVRPEAGTHNEGDTYLALERYYLSKNLGDAAPIYIEIEGHLVEKIEGEEGNQDILVPVQFKEVSKEDTDCD